MSNVSRPLSCTFKNVTPSQCWAMRYRPAHQQSTAPVTRLAGIFLRTCVHYRLVATIFPHITPAGIYSAPLSAQKEAFGKFVLSSLQPGARSGTQVGSFIYVRADGRN